MLRRVVIEKRGRPTVTVDLERAMCTIGRHRSNGIVLEAPSLSRFHAALMLDPDGDCYLQDLGSKNGTFVGNRRVTRERLRSGESFSLGGYSCRYLEDPADEESSDIEKYGEPTASFSLPNIDEGSAFLGNSPAARELLKQARRVAESPAPILITGESGSGKGMLAVFIHLHSRRCKRPFISVNCAAIPGELIESELFGHLKGAFTGASTDRVGKFQAADGGTLLLDEIGDMSLQAQAKSLRAIEDGEIEPVDSNRPVKVDVRVIAATHRDLEGAIDQGSFREDLYFRIAALDLKVPPLRERPDDIILLANSFLAELIAEMPMARDAVFSDSAIEALRRHDWRGNVRQLKNTVTNAVIQRRGPRIEPEDLRLGGMRQGRTPAATETLEAVENWHLRRALEYHDWNRTRTAESLGISRKTLRERMSRAKIRPPEEPPRVKP